jgi:hypothetical protein
MRRSYAATLALAAAFVSATPVAGQQVDDGQQAAWSAGDEDRSTIMRFLERDEVGSAAERMGYDVQDVGRAVLQMSDDDAARVATDVRSAEQALAADTITMTTTTLIIILLVVILLILILD